jgi:NADH:ubiquinone oxidoreductase subunit C
MCNVSFLKKDKRQKFINLSVKVLEKLRQLKIKNKIFNNIESTMVFKQVFPYETFLLLFSSNIKFGSSFTESMSVINFITDSECYYLSSIYLNAELDCIFFPFEVILFTKKEFFEKKIFYCFLLFYCYLRFTSVKFRFITKYNVLKSISGIYAGFSWVERELIEMNSFIINGVKDTRKLLTNYGANLDGVNGILSSYYDYDFVVQELY